MTDHSPQGAPQVSTRVPRSRITLCNDAPLSKSGRFVLYWMTSARRLHYNFALQFAVDVSRSLGKPLLIFEPLRCDYRWASVRFHQFVLEGMRDNAAGSEDSVRYFPYVERSRGEGRGLLRALSEQSCAMVTDDYPCFHLPAMTAAAAQQSQCSMWKVDGNGLMPMRSVDKAFPTAYSLRRHLQRTLPEYLDDFPNAVPLRNLPRQPRAVLPRHISDRWAPVTAAEFADLSWLSSLPIDVAVTGVTGVVGGSVRAREMLDGFIDERLQQYGERNQPESCVTSELSPYLHFGHVSSHEVVQRVLARESWDAEQLSPLCNGRRSGWWGMSDAAEGFLDQIVTWRELGFNNCAHLHNYAEYSSLPEWARQTLEEHADDPREYVYDLDSFDHAETHDPLWNAAQRQLRRQGVIHNYLRMLWGKKILEWSASPREALRIMIELNNRYALDGRDPNSYSGIFWVMGRHDRAWGPERPVFGKIRFMSSQNTARKVSVKNYLEQYSEERAAL